MLLLFSFFISIFFPLIFLKQDSKQGLPCLVPVIYTWLYSALCCGRGMIRSSGCLGSRRRQEITVWWYKVLSCIGSGLTSGKLMRPPVNTSNQPSKIPPILDLSAACASRPSLFGLLGQLYLLLQKKCNFSHPGIHQHSNILTGMKNDSGVHQLRNKHLVFQRSSTDFLCRDDSTISLD